MAANDADSRELAAHLSLLQTATGPQEHHELSSTPLFSAPVLHASKHLFSQYGFLGGLSSVLESNAAGEEIAGVSGTSTDPRLYFNISAPSSAFICGSQGSGKSHTLSCLLENCLVKSHVSKLENPLAGLVFHYDSFTSDEKGTPCEAAHLSSNPDIRVRVLCSPANLQTIKRTYKGMKIKIEPLRIDQSDLNTKRMLDLMTVSQDDGRMPLYLHAIIRILREMRMGQQLTNGTFNYSEFKRMVANTPMTPAQLAPLTQRLDTLESFMPKSQTEFLYSGQPKKKQVGVGGNDWAIKAGSLTIVDLSCPCVTAEGACALFNICLSLFLEQKTSVGRVIALDEAHKYMNSASEASALTNTILSSIRLQRHLGTRVFISTQEPTISPKLLDLCSFTIVHRFSSPDWLQCLKSHLAALNIDIEDDSTRTQKSRPSNIFNQIVKLRVGEALLFAPSATIGVGNTGIQPSSQARSSDMERLGLGYLKIKIRARITTDGGKSVLANGTTTIPSNLKSGIVPNGTSSTLSGAVTASTALSGSKPQVAAPSISGFGAPSPTTGVFGCICATAPSATVSANLETPGTSGSNLAVVNVAMEELGVGRKNELPLADRGNNVSLPDPKAVKRPVVATGPGAAWQNVKFEDVDPADEKLESIADDQLYRLRRDASQNVTEQNPRRHSPVGKPSGATLQENKQAIPEVSKPVGTTPSSILGSRSLSDSTWVGPGARSASLNFSTSNQKDQITGIKSKSPYFFCPRNMIGEVQSSN